MNFATWLTVIVFLFLPNAAGFLWPILGLIRLVGKKPVVVDSVEGCFDGIAYGADARERDKVVAVVNGVGKRWALLPGFMKNGTVVPDMGALARFVLYGDTCLAVCADRRVVYNSAVLPRLLGLRWGWGFAPWACICYSGYLVAATGLMDYKFGFEGLGLAMSFRSYGTGLVLWIVCWIALTAGWIVSYRRRVNRLVAEVEAKLSEAPSEADGQPACADKAV